MNLLSLSYYSLHLRMCGLCILENHKIGTIVIPGGSPVDDMLLVTAKVLFLHM